MKYLILCLTSVPLQLIEPHNCFKLNRSLITLLDENLFKQQVPCNYYFEKARDKWFWSRLPQILRINKKKNLFLFLPEELGNQLKSEEDGINRTIHWLLGSWLLLPLGPDHCGHKLEPRLHLSCWTAPWRWQKILKSNIINTPLLHSSPCNT